MRKFLLILILINGVFSSIAFAANVTNTVAYPFPALPCPFATLTPPIIGDLGTPPANAETPASIACVYGLAPYVTGCPINKTKIHASGGWGIIAVTEGKHDPNAEQELAVFSKKFKLPECTSQATVPGELPCFSVVYATATGLPPTINATGKDLREHALDIEMAHAMAPNAKIIMVEAETFDQPEIFNAVYCANKIVSQYGGGLVSNSWSGHEYYGENIYDSYFQTPGIVYTASSGDFLSPARYPSSSPHVISVGATAFVRDNNGNFKKEIMWFSPKSGEGTSGGPSKYELRPSFQNSVMRVVGNKRGTPDVAAIGSNIAFYHMNELNQGIWEASSGTSFAAPIMAGIINAANSRASTSQEELFILYNGALKHYHEYWHDVLEGNNGFLALQGYDFVSGLGTPLGYLGK